MMERSRAESRGSGPQRGHKMRLMIAALVWLVAHGRVTVIPGSTIIIDICGFNEACTRERESEPPEL